MYASITLPSLVHFLSFQSKLIHLIKQISLAEIPQCDFFVYNMAYSLPYSTFQSLPADSSREFLDPSLPSSSKECSGEASEESEMKLLDLYSGCGAMSTVDLSKDTCKSLELNHPDTKVRNKVALDYLSLLKE
ncbi:hypothetical protein IFM89_003531 [Coptis chinensis]|uniref:Uncharacterized protein n=1 Tax=Coptis chinensis TaxID=261450 RepID=A0A835L9X2_9MAGN|nr:hypothetical protein IFM89_003531 [Coptis chinensis]